MQYFFVLGNHPALSRAELEARLLFTDRHHPTPQFFLGTVAKAINSSEFIKTVGGTIKMGRIITTTTSRPHDIFLASLEILKAAAKSGKFNFGMSSYGIDTFDTRKVGLALKQELKNQGVSCRLVVSREKTLSSVVVEQNKLVSSGRELVYIGDHQRMLIGVTEAVQPFKSLSDRDYGRPARDDYSGMLPPKVAQIMLNLAQLKKTDKLLDPFCGSGTVLTEAMLMGYTHMFGSDISKKAISDSQSNCQWIKKYQPDVGLPQLNVSDARDLLKFHKKNSINAIVTEVYLGPQRGAINISALSRDLVTLYEASLEVFNEILVNGGKIVMALPAFISKGQPQLLPLRIKPFKQITQSYPVSGLTDRQTFLYGRSGQKVWREIIVLEK